MAGADMVSSLMRSLLQEEATAGSKFNPQDPQYLKDTFGAAGVSFVFGVVVLIAFLLFFVIRWCCCCAGAGCCAENKKPASSLSVSCHLIIALVLVLLAAIGGGVMTASGRPVADSFGGLSSTLIDQVDVFMTNLTNIVTTVLDVTPEDQAVDIGALQNAEDDLSTAQESLEEFKEASTEYINVLRNCVQGLGAFILVCTVFGLLTLASRRIGLLIIFLIFSMFGCLVGWGMGGAGLLTNALFTEACDMMEGYLSNKPNEWLDDALPCDELKEASKGMYPAMEAANLAVDAANTEIEDVDEKAIAHNPASEPVPKLCLPFSDQGDIWIRSEPGTNCVEVTEASIQEAYYPLRCPHNLTEGTRPNDNAEYMDCMTDGKPLLPVNYNKLMDSAKSLDKINNVLPQIQNLANCGFIHSAFTEIYNNDCDSLQSSTESMAVGAILAAVSLTLVSLLFCVCIRNIRKQPGSDQMVYQQSTPQKGKYSQPGSPSASSPIGTAMYPGPSAPPAPAMAMV